MFKNLLHPIKFIKGKIIENLIKDAIAELPKLKDNALLYLKEHKQEIINKLFVLIKNTVITFLKDLNKEVDEDKK